MPSDIKLTTSVEQSIATRTAATAPAAPATATPVVSAANTSASKSTFEVVGDYPQHNENATIRIANRFASADNYTRPSGARSER